MAQHRHLGIGRNIIKPVRLVAQVDLDMLVLDPLLQKRDQGALGKGTDLSTDALNVGHGVDISFKLAG